MEYACQQRERPRPIAPPSTCLFHPPPTTKLLSNRDAVRGVMLLAPSLTTFPSAHSLFPALTAHSLLPDTGVDLSTASSLPLWALDPISAALCFSVSAP